MSNKTHHENEGRDGFGRTAARLRVFRVAKGLTQRQLAEIAGLTPQTIGNIEHGRHTPRPLTALALASVLELPVADLFPDDSGGPAK